jgi:hypothetical protein
MCLLSNHHLCGVKQQHPQENLRTLRGWINGRGCNMSSLRFSNDLKDRGVKGVKDLNVHGFCAVRLDRMSHADVRLGVEGVA